MKDASLDSRKSLRIAMIGTRGVPANYGGFETCVEEIGRRLAEQGHEVTVYCRNSYYKNRPAKYRGMNLVYLPNLKKKSLDTMSHTFLSVLHAMIKKYDVHMIFNAANSSFLLPLRLLGKKIIINTDGLEWKRSKWGFWGRTYYKMAEKFACFMANRLVSDSKGMKDYYSNVHSAESTEIAYGAYPQSCNSEDRLQEMGLRPGNYFLQITRFEPENYPLLTIQAFKKLSTDKKLVLVGGNPYSSAYTREIASEVTDNIILPGFIYDQEVLKELWCNCFCYIHGNSVGGTNPALLQTMASGCFTLAIDVAFNHDVLNDCGLYYEPTISSLWAKMEWALGNRDKLDPYRHKAQQRIVQNYSWDEVAKQYEKLFSEVCRQQYPWKFRWRALIG